MIMRTFLTITLGLIYSLSGFATLSNVLPTEDKNVVPKPFVHLDSFFSHHVIVAEKLTHRLLLYKNNNGLPVLLKTYQMATGKKPGNKKFQGDYRTPEGIYQFLSFLSHDDLIKRHGKLGEIYGIGAFVMNYPNPVDSQKGREGGGIWLHSTNDETRIDKGLDSRGCIVAANKDLIEISNYIELNKTPIIVVDQLSLISESTWQNNKQNLMKAINQWVDAWKNEKLEDYLSFYSKTEFKDKYRKNYAGLADHKKRVFALPGKPDVEIKNLTILESKEYVVAKFRQYYKSNTINDVGLKTLYLKKDDYYQWKIVTEHWSKATEEEASEDVALFNPSSRFFGNSSSFPLQESAKTKN